MSTVTTPAFRIASECPTCRAPLALRRVKATGHHFTGCSNYPTCKFTESHDDRLDAIASVLDSLIEQARGEGWPSRQAFADEVEARLAALRGRA